MRFDWYGATVPAQVSHCVSTITAEHGGFFFETPPQSPYKIGLRHSETDFRLSHGGQNPLPYLDASGARAPACATFIRQHYPAHRVARADVCQDFVAAGGYDRITRLLIPVARQARAKVVQYSDPEPALGDGRTLYLGSEKSDVRLTVYEKGRLERSKGADVPVDWFRVELRVRPRKHRKSLAAEMEPVDFFGLARWTLQACELVAGHAPEYVPDLSLRACSTEQSVRHMLRQYSGKLRAYVDLYGRKSLDQLLTDHLADE